MTAREWVAGMSDDSAVRWRALEVAAFEAHPRIVRMLDPEEKYSTASGRGSGRSGALRTLGALGIVVWTFVLIVVTIFPGLIGLAILVGNVFYGAVPDPAFSVPAAGLVFAFAFLVLVASLVLWLPQRHTAKSVGIQLWQTAVTVVTGILSAVVAAVRSAAAGVPNGTVWVGLILLATVFAAVYFVLLLAAIRARGKRRDGGAEKSTRRQHGRNEKGSTLEPLKSVRLAVEQLPGEEQDALHEDIRDAIDLLAERGIVAEAQAEWARQADLGKLALHMSQPRR